MDDSQTKKQSSLGKQFYQSTKYPTNAYYKPWVNNNLKNGKLKLKKGGKF